MKTTMDLNDQEIGRMGELERKAMNLFLKSMSQEAQKAKEIVTAMGDKLLAEEVDRGIRIIELMQELASMADIPRHHPTGRGWPRSMFVVRTMIHSGIHIMQAEDPSEASLRHAEVVDLGNHASVIGINRTLKNAEDIMEAVEAAEAGDLDKMKALLIKLQEKPIGKDDSINGRGEDILRELEAEHE